MKNQGRYAEAKEFRLDLTTEDHPHTLDRLTRMVIASMLTTEETKKDVFAAVTEVVL